MKWPSLLVVSVLLGAASADELPQRQFKVYPLGTADPVSTEEAVRVIVGEEGSVVPDPKHRRLLIMATEEEHAQISDLLKQIDLPARNVRIDVEFRGAGVSRESAAAIRGDGRLVLGSGGTHGRINLKPELKHQVTRTQSQVRQSLVVSSGKEAALMVGQEVPYREWLLDYATRWGYLKGPVRWRQVGARLVVQPTVLGDGHTIRVRLTPELSGYDGDQSARTRFARVATEVLVGDGETIQLGGVNKDQSFYSRFLVGVDRQGQQQRLDILLTPHIMERRVPPER